VRGPVTPAAGWNVTVTVQLLPESNVPPAQALTANSAEVVFTPVTAVLLKLVIVNDAVLGFGATAGGPAFADVAVPRERAVVLKYTASEAAPVRATVSGVEPGLKETSIVAVRELPAAVTDGLYSTDKVQVLAAASVDEHEVWVPDRIVKSAAAIPVIFGVTFVNGEVSVLVKVID
jgi:hypothetical protein